MHSADEDASHLLPHVEVPIHVYRNQLVFDPEPSEYLCEQPHRGFERHLIPVGTSVLSELVVTLGKYLKPSVINGIKIPETYLSSFQRLCLENFAAFKIRITQRLVVDLSIPKRSAKPLSENIAEPIGVLKRCACGFWRNFISPRWLVPSAGNSRHASVLNSSSTRGTLTDRFSNRHLSQDIRVHQICQAPPSRIEIFYSSPGKTS